MAPRTISAGPRSAARARAVAGLEPALAVGQPELGRRQAALRTRRPAGRGPTRGSPPRRRRARRHWPRPPRRRCPGWPARTRGRTARRAWVTVAARAIGRPASATRRPSAISAPSARSWMTRPRIPASAMTMLLPRPSTTWGRPRDRANFTRPRSSNALCATAKRSAGPPTRIVVNRASGSSREVFTPSRRWMSVPRAIASNARADVVIAVIRRLAREAVEDARLGQRAVLGGGEDELGHRVRRARPAQRRGSRRPSRRARRGRRGSRSPRGAPRRRTPRPR